MRRYNRIAVTSPATLWEAGSGTLIAGVSDESLRALLGQFRNMRKSRTRDDPLSRMTDKTTVKMSGQVRGGTKKRFNFLTPERFIAKPDTTTEDVLERKFLREGTSTTIFAAANNFNYLYFTKFRRWFINDRITSAKGFPKDLAQRLAFNNRIYMTTPGLLSYATETRSLVKSVRKAAPALPLDLLWQIRHGYVHNIANSPDVLEWQRILDIENVDLSKSIIRDRPILELLCFYVNGCYGDANKNTLAESVFRSYRVGSIPVKNIMEELMTVKVGKQLVDYKLSETTLPLTHQATIAAAILYRNHPLMPNPHTFVGLSQKRYEAVVSKRSKESHSRVSKNKGPNGEDIASILDPKYNVATDMCGIIDFLDSSAYLSSTSRLISFRNAQTASALLANRRMRDERPGTFSSLHNPQMDFISRIVNTMSADEQLKLVKYVDRFSHRICRELERELVAVSAFTAYTAHNSEFRYFNRPITTYQTIFDAATVMHSCTTSRHLPRFIFMYFSSTHRERYGIFTPHLVLPSRGSALWAHLYRRETFARGNKLGHTRRMSLDKPFEYGDGAPNVTSSDFKRMSVLQRAALEYCFPAKLSLGEEGRSYTNPFNNYCSLRMKEIKSQSRVALPLPALMALVAREWYGLAQEEKRKYDIKSVVGPASSLSFPISGVRPVGPVSVDRLPSEPIATPLAPVSPSIKRRPQLVNLGRYQPTHPRFHKDPLVRIDFSRPTERLPLSFFAKKALDIIRTHLDTAKIVKAPSLPTVLSVPEIEREMEKRSKDQQSAAARKDEAAGKVQKSEVTTGGIVDPLPPLTRLNKVPQQHLPDVVLSELARSGIYDTKQPIPFDLELGKDVLEFRVSTLRAENPLRTAIATRFTRSRAWSPRSSPNEGVRSPESVIEETKRQLIEEGHHDLAEKIQYRKDSPTYLSHGGKRFHDRKYAGDGLAKKMSERKSDLSSKTKTAAEKMAGERSSADWVRNATSQFVPEMDDKYDFAIGETPTDGGGEEDNGRGPDSEEEENATDDQFDAFEEGMELYDEHGNLLS